MKRLTITLMTGILIYSACDTDKVTDQNGGEKLPQDLRFRVEEAPEWSALFHRGDGWFGGDGIFAIPLDGKENLAPGDTTQNLFVFSDTMYGMIEEGQLQEGYTMVNNSVAILDGHDPDPSKITFMVKKDGADQPTSIFVPQTAATQPGEYFWLGDGFVNEFDNAFYLFAYRIINIPEREVFGFEEVGNVLIKIPKDSAYPYGDMTQFDIPFHDAGPRASMGTGIFVNTAHANAPDSDGFVYVYGVRGEDKELVVARMLPDQMTTFSKWEFWNGSDWTLEAQKAVGLGTGVSNEMSVSPLPNGQYALVFQQGIFTNKVAMRIGDTPYGPFSEDIILWDCKDDLEGEQFFAYNAKAYPSLSKQGELLISYNINSFDFFNEIENFPNLYRPRFIKVIFEE